MRKQVCAQKKKVTKKLLRWYQSVWSACCIEGR